MSKARGSENTTQDQSKAEAIGNWKLSTASLSLELNISRPLISLSLADQCDGECGVEYTEPLRVASLHGALESSLTSTHEEKGKCAMWRENAGEIEPDDSR